MRGPHSSTHIMIQRVHGSGTSALHPTAELQYLGRPTALAARAGEPRPIIRSLLSTFSTEGSRRPFRSPPRPVSVWKVYHPENCGRALSTCRSATLISPELETDASYRLITIAT